MEGAALHAHALIRGPDGVLHELAPGDLVGRAWSAVLQLDDGRVSEAHAMVRLREGLLELVALRGGLGVGGRPVDRAPLRPGLRILLAQGVELEVVEVQLPDVVLGIEGEGLPRQALPGVCSVLVDPGLRLARGIREEAAACLWSSGEAWTARLGGGAPFRVRAGDTLALDRHTLRLVEIPVGAAGRSETRRRGALDRPLVVVAHYDTVHLHRDGEPVLSFSGKQARLISELAACRAPLSWQALAGQLWTDGADEALLRSRLDVVLARLRRKLRARGVRADLVRSDGAGMIELLLYPDDRLEDHS